MSAAAIKATFSDFKHVKTRSVVQFVFELPIEQADDALRALGGLPRPSEERWCGIARLDMKAVSEPVKEIAAPKDRRPFDDLPPAMQAGIRCSDLDFIKWINASLKPLGPPLSAEDVANSVRAHCSVSSRSELNTNPEAAAKWRELNDAFEKHKRGWR